MDLGLTGKTVIVTGGSGGIGHGLLIEFAREGANVISASRNAEHGEGVAAAIKAAGLPGTVRAIATDVTERASVDAMIAATHEAFGPVDVLINNAGGIGTRGPLEEIDDEARRFEIALNIDGVMNCIQAVAPDMLGRRTGSVINISSLAAINGPSAHHSVHYGAAKGFVNSLTRGLSWEWGPFGVRVNDIAPGWTVPHSLEDVSEGSAWKRIAQRTPDEMAADLEAGTLRNMPTIPLGRLGRPEDVARLACFLASDMAGYITGQRIAVAGGVYQN